jgi:hypothetical protein
VSDDRDWDDPSGVASDDEPASEIDGTAPGNRPEIDETLAVGRALSGAGGRLVRPLGPAIVAVYLLVGFAGAVATTSLFAAVVPRARTFLLENTAAAPADLPPTDPSPLALGVDPVTAAGLVLVTALLAETVNVVAIRVFVDDARSLPEGAFEELRATALISFVANSLAAVAIFAGFLAFLLPGIFLAIAFYLVRAVVIVEGAGVVPALRRSWRLVAGNRLRVLLVLLVVVLFRQAATLPGGLADGTPLTPTVAAALGVVLGAVVTAFAAAVAARVYVQLAGIDAAAAETAGEAEPEDDDEDDEPLGALSPEEIDEQFGDG